MAHAHHHHQNHDTPVRFNRAFVIAIVANGLFVIFQAAFAFFANSTSLLADSVHNLGDVLGLILSWLANRMLARTPSQKQTYGLKKTSILAALANGIMLVFTCGMIATEAIYKFFTPTPVDSITVMWVATLAIVVNGTTAFLFLRGKSDLNIRSAFLHLLYDAFISVGVVVAALILYWTHWNWIDPLVGLLIALIIIKGTWTLFTDSFRLLIDGVPREISWQAVYDELKSVPGVQQIHDLHIWALSTRETALSVHLFMPEIGLSDPDRQELTHRLKEKFNIHHTTIQVENNLSFYEDNCFF